MQVFLTDYNYKDRVSLVLIVLLNTAIFAYFILIIRNFMLRRCKKSNSKVDKTKDMTVVSINEGNQDKEMPTNLNDFVA